MSGKKSQLLASSDVVLATESRSGMGGDQAKPFVQWDDPAFQLRRATWLAAYKGSRVRSAEEQTMEAGRRLGAGFPWALSRDPFESDGGSEVGNERTSGVG